MNIPKILQNACFLILFFCLRMSLMIRFKVGYYPTLKHAGNKKSNRIGPCILKNTGCKLLWAFSLLMIVCVSNADVYKWIDSQGNVHFSDTPHPGAKKMDIPDAQGYSTPQPNAETPPQSEEKKSDTSESQTYTRLSIVQPENKATIRNNQGYLVVSVELDPELKPGDKLQILFDGALIGEPQTALLFQLNGIFRGSHTIAVQAIDAKGNVLITSEPITIFMHRPRVGINGTQG